MLELLKLIWSAVPFVREMFWPGKTSKEVLSSNKMATFVIVVCISSLSLNYFLMSRIWALAVAKRSVHQTAVASRPPGTAASGIPAPGTSSSAPAASIPASAPNDMSDADKKAQDDLRARLNALFGKNP